MNAFTVQDAPLNMAPTGIATFAKVPGKNRMSPWTAWNPQCIYPLPHEKGRQL